MQAFFKKSLLISFLAALCGDGDGFDTTGDATATSIVDSGEESSNDASGGAMLRQVALPYGFAGRSYADLVRYLVSQHGVVPLGLYRSKRRENPAWRLGYVVTNPPPDEILEDIDRVFVLRALQQDETQ